MSVNTHFSVFSGIKSHKSYQDYSISCHDPVNFTNYPMVTGSSVVGLTCSDCILIAADTLGSYGSLSRFKSITRIKSVGMFEAS